jgi:hypothetical protein
MTAFTGNIDTDIMWGGKDNAYVKLDVEEIAGLLSSMNNSMSEGWKINKPLYKKLEKALEFFSQQNKGRSK